MLTVPALRLLGAGEAPGVDLEAAARWYRERSGGAFEPRFEVLAELELERLGRFRGLGGLDRFPDNAQGLVLELLEALDGDGRRRLAELGGVPLILAPRGFRPHCWSLPPGRRRLAGGLFCRRYGLLPADASLGVTVHELGHLLLRWPDLERGTGIAGECVMATGAKRGGGRRPAPPCAPLRVRAGWVEAFEPDRGTRLAALADGAVARVGEQLVELRERPLRLLRFEDRPRPRLAARLPCRPEDLDRPLLAVLRFSAGHASE